MNLLIDGLNWLGNWSWDAVTILGQEVIPAGSVSLWNIPHLEVPKLAQGAVIPPNREFMAVLGDQSHGTNVEAPLDTIVEAVRTANAAGNADVVAALNVLIQELRRKDLTVNLDGREMARNMYRPLREVERTIGGSLVTVG